MFYVFCRLHHHNLYTTNTGTTASTITCTTYATTVIPTTTTTTTCLCMILPVYFFPIFFFALRPTSPLLRHCLSLSLSVYLLLLHGQRSSFVSFPHVFIFTIHWRIVFFGSSFLFPFLILWLYPPFHDVYLCISFSIFFLSHWLNPSSYGLLISYRFPYTLFYALTSTLILFDDFARGLSIISRLSFELGEPCCRRLYIFLKWYVQLLCSSGRERWTRKGGRQEAVLYHALPLYLFVLALPYTQPSHPFSLTPPLPFLHSYPFCTLSSPPIYLELHFLCFLSPLSSLRPRTHRRMPRRTLRRMSAG